MSQEELEKYGNKLVITGMLVGNGEVSEIIRLPGTENVPIVADIIPSIELADAIFRQLDVVEITTPQKIILRKSQRNLDATVSWTVFKRDGYKCVYCGNDNTPLTVDHLILWENGGPTMPDNLVAACKKCNHTRGNTELTDFLISPYFKKVCKNPEETKKYVNSLIVKAYQLPKVKQRSR